MAGSVYLAQARYALIQTLAMHTSHLDDRVDENVCGLNTFNFVAATDLLHVVAQAFRNEILDGERPLSPTDLIQYDGINTSSSKIFDFAFN